MNQEQVNETLKKITTEYVSIYLKDLDKITLDGKFSLKELNEIIKLYRVLYYLELGE